MAASTQDIVKRVIQGNDKWPPSTNPSARLRAARAMPQWITARGSALPPPPPPPLEEPTPIEPEYEVIEFPGQQTYSNQPVIRNKEKEKKRCDLCGSSAPAVKCLQCVQQNFCYSCDEMYHRHPKRQSHVRKELDGGGGRPPLPPKGEPPPPPVPPPRRNKRPTPRPTPPPPHLPPGPHIMQRESVSPKPGLMGSLKKIIGVRPPGVSQTLDRQNSLPPNSSMIGFHDQMMNCNGFPDWTEMHRGHRSGSFTQLNSPPFGHMMQAQSMAHLNCPSCHGQGMWNPWTGMPPTGTWQSSNFLNRGPAKEEWSESDSDQGWQRERLRRFSTVSARAPRSYAFDEIQPGRSGRRTDVETSSHKGGRRRELDTLSNRGGRRQELDIISNRGGRKQDFDTMSNRGGRKQDFDTMSLRGGRKSDLESSSFRSQRKYIDDRPRKIIDTRYRHETDDSESSEERESDNDFLNSKPNRKVMSDLEDIHRGRRHSQPASPAPVKMSEVSQKKKNKRNERFTDTGRRRSSPVQYKYESPSGEEDEPIIENVQEPNDNIQNGVETIEDEPEVEELGPIPDSEWECNHCTFVNDGGSRVCAVCCKTSPKPKLLKSQGPPTKETQKPSLKETPGKTTVKETHHFPEKGLQSPSQKLEEEMKKRLNLEEKTPKEDLSKNMDKTEKMKERRGTQSPERNRTLTSKGTSPPPQSISTQTYEEAGRKLKRATSLADYSDWKAPQRSASRQSLLSDTQSLPVTPPRSRSPEQLRREIMRRSSDLFSQRSNKRAGSQPPEYISTLVQKQVKQGLEMVKLLREAEEHQFSAEDLAVALLHCGDGDPIIWLQENWRNMIDTVVTLGTNYGQERKENTVGTISASEAREALRGNDGNVWAAVTECVEQRQRKYGDLLSRGNFSREDIVTALTATHGNVEEAYKELNKNQLKPFLMRIWGPPQGEDNDDGDFTKLAHGDMEGRGGKNSEEVSVDLSTDTNYERIQNWLENHVYNLNKINHSQSMLHLNVGGLGRSESEWKINPLPDSSSSSTILKNRQNSDIQKYLKNVYNSNNKSLFVTNHSISSLNLEKDYSNINFSLNQENQPLDANRQSNRNANIEESNDDEIETITIKLNPTIVKSEYVQQTLQTEVRNSESESSQSNSEESESESESNISEDPHELIPVNQHLKVEEAQIKDTSSASGCPSEKSEVKHEISKSNSETSSESFESVHSSEQGNKETQFSTLKRNSIENLMDDDKISMLSQEDLRKSSLDQGTNDYANISVLKFHKKEDIQHNTIKEEVSTNKIKYEELSTSGENITNRDASGESSSQLMQNGNSEDHLGTKISAKENSLQESDKIYTSNSTVETEHLNSSSYLKNGESSHDLVESENTKRNSDFSESTNDSEEKFMEVSSDDEIPFIEELNENVSAPEKTTRTIPVASNEEYDSEDDIGFHSSEVPIIINKEEILDSLEKKDHASPTINNANLMVPGKKKVSSKNQAEFYKSGSDINDEQSNDFSEESLDYNEGRQLSPITATPLRRDLSLRFSDGNSDIDVSSIPTDSEKDSHLDAKEANNFNKNKKRNKDNLRIGLPSNQAELLELLKKSLTKDDVVEKLVSTLFASVLQATVGTSTLLGENVLGHSTNKIEMVANEDEDPDVLRTQGENEKNDQVINSEEQKLDHIMTNEEHDNNEHMSFGENEGMMYEENEISNPIADCEGNSNNNSTNLSGPEAMEQEINLPSNFEEVINLDDEPEQRNFEEETNVEIFTSEARTNNEEGNDMEVVGVVQGRSIEEIKNQVMENILEAQNSLRDNSAVSVREDSGSNHNLQDDNDAEITVDATKTLQTPSNSNLNSETFNSNTTVVDETNDLKTIENVTSIQSNKDETFSPEREARRLLAEGLVSTYDQAEIAVQLKQLNLEDEMILTAAKECNSLEAAIAFLQQECQLCAGKCSIKEMVSMLECEHRCCLECANNYFTLQITERNINDCVCPFCKEPDIFHIEEDKALTYFSHLDIFLKGIVKENIHELFQRKLRDRTLMQDPNFKWCVKCSSGYIANPRQKRLMCPDCKAITCAKCMKPWEKEHEKMSCEEYKEWLDQNDPDHQLEKHLDENGVTCPHCKSKYILAKGGCMHLTCPQCKHEFCSGCTKPFLMGRKCTVSEYCEKLGLHSHHPRNCLFYLRDKEPEELEKLLEDNNIQFRKREENDAKRCGIQLLKETADGLVEGTCGYTTLKAGLCRTHYIESLVLRIRLNNVDPVKLLDFAEAVQELRRHGKTLPERPAGMSEYHYRQICYKVIEEEIPLE